MILFLLASLPHAPAQAQIPAVVGKTRWGYYVAYDPASLSSLKDHIKDLDYLSPWWYKMDGQGNIVSAGDRDVSDSQIEIIMGLARANGVRVVPMIKNIPGGAEFHAVLADPPTRTKAVNNIVGLVASRNFDGAHIDFEWIDGADRPYLTAFMAQLAPALRSRGKLVTQVVPAKEKERFTGWAGAFDYAALARHNDLIVIMAYGYKTANSWPPGSTAPFDWVEGAAAYSASQIPAQKVVLGVPWWGYDWNKAQGTPAVSLRYDQILALSQKYGAPIQYDEATQTSYLRYTDQGQEHEVWFDNQRSVDAKLDLVFEYNLGGAAGWRMGHEDPAVWQSFTARLGFRTWLLAEGSTGTPYHTWILIMNPGTARANVTVTFMTEVGTTVVKRYQVSPTSRFSVFANQVVPNAAISTKVESDRPIFVERAMYFGHDGHDSLGVNAGRYKWYLPEGYTGPGVDTWVLLMNPNSAPANVKVTFMKEDGTVEVRQYRMVGTSRLNIWADQIVPGVAFSTLVEADQPVVAERAMYFDGGKGGHGSAGAYFPAKTWYFAEGFTGYQAWLFLMNPNSATVEAKVSFLKENGGVETRIFSLKPTSRQNVYVNGILPYGVAFGITVSADQPIVAERALYWDGSRSGHSTMGVAAPARTWYLPEGSTAYPFDEWLLLANPGPSQASVSVTYMLEGAAPVQRNYVVGAASRLTINVDQVVPASAVSVRVESDQPLVVERSMYFGTGGHNSVGVSQ